MTVPSLRTQWADEWMILSIRERWAIFTMGCFLLGAFVCLGVMAGRAMPVTRTVTTVIEERAKYPSLENPADVCRGAPGEVMNISSQQFEDGWVTFMTLRPVGDTYQVPCAIRGGWVHKFPVGSVVAIPNGAVSG